MNGLHRVLPTYDRAELIAAVSGTSNGLFDQLSSATKEAALVTIVESLRKLFILVYVGAAVGMVASKFIKVR